LMGSGILDRRFLTAPGSSRSSHLSPVGGEYMTKNRFSWRAAMVVAVLGLVAAAVVAASAWARGGHAQASVLVDGTTDSVTNIDPANEYDYGTATLDLLIFQGLYGYPHGAKLEPVLATKCVAKSGNKSWTCGLKRNIKFSDGSPL